MVSYLSSPDGNLFPNPLVAEATVSRVPFQFQVEIDSTVFRQLKGGILGLSSSEKDESIDPCGADSPLGYCTKCPSSELKQEG